MHRIGSIAMITCSAHMVFRFHWNRLTTTASFTMIDTTAAIKTHRIINCSYHDWLLKLSPHFDWIMLMMLENSNFANEKSKVMKIHIVKSVAREDEKAEKRSLATMRRNVCDSFKWKREKRNMMLPHTERLMRRHVKSRADSINADSRQIVFFFFVSFSFLLRLEATFWWTRSDRNEIERETLVRPNFPSQPDKSKI